MSKHCRQSKYPRKIIRISLRFLLFAALLAFAYLTFGEFAPADVKAKNESAARNAVLRAESLKAFSLALDKAGPSAVKFQAVTGWPLPCLSVGSGEVDAGKAGTGKLQEARLPAPGVPLCWL